MFQDMALLNPDRRVSSEGGLVEIDSDAEMYHSHTDLHMARNQSCEAW